MLASLLTTLQSAADLTRLFAHLGYAPAADPFDDEALLVARWHRFRVIAHFGGDATTAARMLAHRLSLTGTLGLAAAVGDDRELVLTAPRSSTPGTCRLLRVSLDHPEPTALEILADLAPRPDTTALAHALRVVAILSTETAGSRFFASLRIMLERMAGAIDRRHTSDDRRMVALLALTRVLFLYFVQAKGWLDENPHFLRDALDRALRRRRDFHRSFLHPLFFGTLNRSPGERSRHLDTHAIPYLNGGLFEPHAVERRLRHSHFPNYLWRDAFDTVFDRFRFCVREAAEVDAVHPDMLGHVFERLMHADERSDSGTFYTPNSVVRELVDATLETALGGLGQLGPVAASDWVRRHRLPHQLIPRARRVLATLRVLDPAAGSGAFLLGALEQLTHLRLILDPPGAPSDRWRVRRDILAQNLFGVDVNPVAVRLTELRLWLALVADDPTRAIPDVAPLPNLNGVVRQGDSLLDPLGVADRSSAVARSRAFVRARDAVARRRGELFEARSASRATVSSALRAAERELADMLLASTLAQLDHSIGELEALERNLDLFGKPVRLTAEQLGRRRAMTRWRVRLRLERRRLDDGGVPFFSFDLFAPEVARGRGFDIVLGNPPWVRAERIDPDLRDTLRDRFTWWRADGGIGFRHLPDLAVAFLERALELVAPNGVVGMLVPNKLATATYGERARRAMVRETTIAYLHRVPEPQAREFGATTYPMAVVLENRAPAIDHEVQLGFAESVAVCQSDLDRAGPWQLVPRDARRALDEFLESGTPLSAEARIALGVKTGADSLFVGAIVDRGREVARVRMNGCVTPFERRVLRPAVRGRDVAPFRLAPRRVLVWTHGPDDQPLAKLPSHAARHFEQHITRLMARSDYRNGPPWMLFRTTGAATAHRVIWPDIARRPGAVVPQATPHSDVVPLNTCYVALCRNREAALCASAVINSVWTTAYVTVSADEARGGYRRMNATVMERIPMPQRGPARRALAVLAARRHRKPHENEDATLDEAVAAALGLSPGCRAALLSLAADHIGRPARRS